MKTQLFHTWKGTLVWRADNKKLLQQLDFWFYIIINKGFVSRSMDIYEIVKDIICVRNICNTVAEIMVLLQLHSLL